MVAQPHDLVDMHTLPPVDVAQSAAAAHPQVCADVLQVGPRGLAAQSALVAHPTHRPVVVLHAGPSGLPVQSALLAQALLHWVPLHTWPVAQSVIVMQPQSETGAGMPGRGNGCMRTPHCVPPAALAQSAMAKHPHVCVVVSHTEPLGLVAQSALALHAFSHLPRKSF